MRHERIRSPLVFILLAFLAGACARGPGPGPGPDPTGASPAFPATVAESSAYMRTARYEDVLGFLDTLASMSERVHLASLGRTVEGRDIPLAIVADPPVRSAQEAARDSLGRMPVLLIGNIHAGEVCGKEALLVIARRLALEAKSPLLERLIVCMVPIYNADGNERFAPDNRPGQVGPEEMGVRPNAQGFDLNRDYIKAEAPETRALIGFLNEWDPPVIVDTHTTNGSLHRYTLTYQGPKNPAGDPRVVEHVRDRMLPAIDRSFEESTGYRAFFYGNFEDGHSRWTTYPDAPRFGVAYRGLRNRLSIITEAYAYAPFKDRVLATLAFCTEVLDYSARHAGEIRALVEAADEATVLAGRRGEPIAIRSRVVAFPERATVLGYEAEAGTEGSTTRPREYEVEFENLFVPTLTVARPRAYAFPASLTGVLERLRIHGIAFHVIEGATGPLATETCTIESFSRGERAFQGHRPIFDVEVSVASGRTVLPAGTIVVPTDQPLGSLAAYLLEAQSDDGLVTWNFLDEHLAPGSVYPIIRVLDAVPGAGGG